VSVLAAEGGWVGGGGLEGLWGCGEVCEWEGEGEGEWW